MTGGQLFLRSSFVGFVDWFKAREDQQYMHYVLERADCTLNDVKSFSLHDYKCILFQILFALYVAQQEYEFMHNDLHKKVLQANYSSVTPPEHFVSTAFRRTRAGVQQF